MSFFSGLFNTVTGKSSTARDISKITGTITPNSGFDQLDIIIYPGETIRTRAECQIIIDNNLKIEADTGGDGAASGLWQSMSTGTFFMNKISYMQSDASSSPVPAESTEEGTDKQEETEKQESTDQKEIKGGAAEQGVLSIFSILPGKIKEIVIKPKTVWCIHHSTFLACTENITVSSGLSLSTEITGNGLFYTKAENSSETDGRIWLTAYGGVIERPLKDKRNFLVHSGLFLAIPNSVYEKISIKRAGSIFTSIAGGEGIMMDFSQTDTDDIVYLQSGNVNAFLDFISSSVNSLPIDNGVESDNTINTIVSTEQVEEPDNSATLESLDNSVTPAPITEPEDITSAPAPEDITAPTPAPEDITAPSPENITAPAPENITPPSPAPSPENITSPEPVSSTIESSNDDMNKESVEINTIAPNETISPPPLGVPIQPPVAKNQNISNENLGGKRNRKTKSKYFRKGRKTHRRR